MQGKKSRFARLMKKRLKLTRLALLVVFAVSLVTQPIYLEHPVVSLLFQTLGFSLLLACALGRLWILTYIGGYKNKRLITEGPYSVVRNPLYCFNFLGFTGIGFSFESLLITCLLTTLFFPLHWTAVLQEEKKLRAYFGKEYDNYAGAVPRWIPQFGNFSSFETLRCNPDELANSVIESALIFSLFPLSRIIAWLHTHSIVPSYFNLI